MSFVDSSRDSFVATNLETSGFVRIVFQQQLLNTFHEALVDPVKHELIWCQQPNGIITHHDMQRADPGAELLWGQFIF